MENRMAASETFACNQLAMEFGKHNVPHVTCAPPASAISPIFWPSGSVPTAGTEIDR